MIALLNFFEESTSESTGTGMPAWVTYVIFGVLIVGLILMMIIPQRKQKKRQEEMMATLAVGCTITSIGGIIGEVVELDDKYIWIETGVEGSKTTMKLLRQAIHSIDPIANKGEVENAGQQETNEETDEIK